MFWKPAQFPYIGKEAPNLVDRVDQAILSNGHHRNIKLLRYAPQNRYSPRVVTQKWQLKNLK
jgi:hypothetical protein